MPTHFALIGYPLSHSFSEGYFTEKFARLGIADTHAYATCPLASITELSQLLATRPHLRGLNVTIPYKEQVIPYLAALDPAAAAIGAVNTILIQDGRLTGYNTDVIGFGNSLDVFLHDNGGPAQSALILGTGGAAKAIAWSLAQRGVAYQYVSRRPAPEVITYAQVDEQLLNKVDLIVNTTPLGMSPKVDTCPDLPYAHLHAQHRLYDLVYNPAETLFLRRGRQQGCPTLNGLPMLHGQAEAAWAIWQQADIEHARPGEPFGRG